MIQNIRVVRLLSDRLFGVGSVGIDSAGNPTTEVWWIRIADAHAAADLIREAIAASKTNPPTAASTRPLVVGLTGSIAGGKSTAAGILRGMGCLVIDADADAKAALDRPDVRQSLVAWWGPKILASDGTVDRKTVAGIIFENTDERARLERLVHPIVRRSRADMIARAAAEGREVVVADVPLLYEAGVDAECDAVIFIDAPRETRLARVASRGWDEAEMTRREAAQWIVADKKSRADERIENVGTPADLARSLGETLTRLKTRPRR
jgi:dephospho-CoA kinase